MLPAAFTPRFLKQLELLKMRARRSFLGTRQGGHVSIKRGHGIEFSDYRKYELGDNPRHIDWNAFARSERLYVKRFQEEQDLSVLIVIDSTASMSVPADEGKWEMACNLTLALAYVSLMQQDRVTVSIPGYLDTPHFSGGQSMHQLSSIIGDVKVGETVDFPRGLHQAISRVKFPGLAIFISDFLMPLDEIRPYFDLMRSKNLDIHAIQVLAPSDVNPLAEMEHAVAVDSETGEELLLSMNSDLRQDYGYLLDSHNEQLGTFLSERQITLTNVVSDQDISEFVTGKLANTDLFH